MKRALLTAVACTILQYPGGADTSGSDWLPFRKGQKLGDGFFVESSMRYGRHSYTVIRREDGLTWDESKSIAEKLKGYLVTITSQKELEAVMTLLKKSTREGFYIGITDEKEEGRWEWVTGEKVEYTNWAPGEPNNAGAENCGTITTWDEGKWTRGAWNDIYAHWKGQGCIVEIGK